MKASRPDSVPCEKRRPVPLDHEIADDRRTDKTRAAKNQERMNLLRGTHTRLLWKSSVVNLLLFQYVKRDRTAEPFAAGRTT